MQEVFLPDLVASYRWLSLCLVLGGAGVYLAVASFRRRDFPARPAAQLLGLTFASVGLLSALFVGWDVLRTRALVVADDYLLLGDDTIRAAEVTASYLETVSEYNLMGEPAVDTVGVIEFADGRAQLFSGEQYPVRDLILATRRLPGLTPAGAGD